MSERMASLKYYVIIISILLLAFALRIFAIDQTPPGLSHDEAYNGVAAMQVLDGYRPIFFEINKGIEPLIIYLEALAFYLFGIGPVQLRLVNIFAGMLTVALLYPFTSRLFNRRVGLLAMAGIAISFWAIFVSRLTLRAVLLPPLLLLTLYFFWQALIPNHHQSSKPVNTSLIFFILSGLFAGITMYTYLSSRFLLFIPLVLFAYQFICRRIKRVHWLGVLLFLVIWGILFFPLVDYFLENVESFTRRSNQVTTIPHALNGDFEPMLRNTLRTLGMFNFKGDTTDRYNLDGRPVFSWFNGLFFLLGMGVVVWSLTRRPRNAAAQVLLLSTAFFMLIPDLITDDSPHFLRTIGVLPVVYIFWALGVDTIAQLLGNGFKQKGLTNSNLPYQSFVLTIILLTTISTGYSYFVRWANASDARHIYGADIAEIADFLRSSDSIDLPVISAEYYRDLDRFRFDLHFGGKAPFAIWFDGQQSLAFPPPESGLTPRYIFPNSAAAPNAWSGLLTVSPKESGQEYNLYRLSDDTLLQSLQDDIYPVEKNINDDLILRGYQLLDDVVTGGRFKLLLVWQALRTLPPGTDYTFLVQLRDAQDRVWFQTDGNGYDPGDWQPDVVGLQLLTFNLPGDLPPRTYTLTAQVVNRQTGQSLPTSEGDTSVLLGTVTARLAGTPREIDPDRLPNALPLTPPDRTGLVLRGYKLSQPVISPNTPLGVTLHWQVLEQPQQNYQLQFSLVDQNNQTLYPWPNLEPIGGEWPTHQWPTDYWMQDRLDLPLTSDILSGEFTLHVGWADESEKMMEAPIELGVIRVNAKE